MQRVRVPSWTGHRPVLSKAAPRPVPWRPNYIHHRALAAQLRTQSGRRLRGKAGLSVADVGCGSRPYEDFFRPFASEYLGIDYRGGAAVDVVAPAEALPFEAERFDAVLSTQMLEHVEAPTDVVSEFSRVLKPGGHAFVSTHGVMIYHPNPDDYWRWTHAGLWRLFEDNGSWSRIDVYPNGGTGSALAYLAGHLINITAATVRLSWAVRPLIATMNLVGWTLDRLDRRLRRERPPHLAPSYLVVATRR